ncbi:MAG: flavin reductase family protein [Acidimicrobiales bacterium]|jgi:flavin reductase (DIM6/NTAB) family NADH-FMN oxidoreductase RutF
MTTTFNTTQFKEAMSRFATGVTIVTALEEGAPVGFSCQTFVSLSLDPPLVALAPAKTSTSWPRIARAGSFCVNVLSARQSAVCMNFAVSGGDKFVGVPWHSAETGGAPIIEGSLAWIDCELELVHDAGDHELVIGKVLDLGLGEGEPLVYYRSGFGHLTELDPG